MTPVVSTLTIRFSTAGSATYRVDLEGSDVGERHSCLAVLRLKMGLSNSQGQCFGL